MANANEFKFDLQQVTLSDQACVDGSCFVALPDPEVVSPAAPADSLEAPQHD